MYTIYDFRHLGLLIVGFNSCDKIDHRAHLDESRRQGFICEQAIENARQEISKAPCELVVAVWHHNPFPVASATDFLTNGHKVAEILGSKCRLALHGHIHQLANTQILPSTFSAPGIRCVGAGTIGVKEEHRGGTAREGHFPMSFNVIELNLDSLLYKGRIHTLYAIVSGLGDIRTLDWQRFTWDGKQWYDFELA
jgi:hypothetical protein